MAFGSRAEIRERQSSTVSQGRRTRPMITRRKIVLTMAGAAGAALAGMSGDVFGQGISSRGVKAQPRGKPSGRPFLAHFTDVAKHAGLTEPVIYGGLESK